MEIDKRTAMSLVKVLCHYNSMTTIGGYYPVVDNVDGMINFLEDFILESNDAPKTFSDNFKIDGDVYPESLCELKSARGHINNSCVGDPGDDVEVSFKRVIKDAGEVDTFLSVNREMVGPITYIRMFDRELQVCTGQGLDRTWNYFDIENIPVDWSTLFGKTNSCYRVINWE